MIKINILTVNKTTQTLWDRKSCGQNDSCLLAALPTGVLTKAISEMLQMNDALGRKCGLRFEMASHLIQI